MSALTKLSASLAQSKKGLMFQRGTVAVVGAALLAISWVSTPEGGPGQKVATALEEMSLIMVLLLMHLMFSKFYGEEPDETPKKKLAPDDLGPEHDGALSDADASSDEPTTQHEEFQSQEIGKLTTKIRTAVRAGNMAEAESVMKELQALDSKPGNLRRACWAVAYGELVGGYARSGNAEKASGWLDAFAAGAPLIRPSTACANSVITVLGAKGLVSEAEAWLARMPQIGIRIDEETYSAVIGACTCAGDADRAIHWLREMRKFNMRPSSELHKLVLQACGDDSAGSPAAQAVPATELPWRQHPATPTAAEDRAKDADTDVSWRAAPNIHKENADTDISWRAAPNIHKENADTDISWRAAPNIHKDSADTDISWRAAPQVHKEAEDTDSSWRVAPQVHKEAEKAATSCSRDEEKEKATDWGEWRPPSSCHVRGANLEGTWSDEWGETYEVWAQGAAWHCTRWSHAGVATSFAIVHDKVDGAYWWGDDWKCYLEEGSDELGWYDAKGWQGPPAVIWWKQAARRREGAGGTSAAGAPAGRTALRDVVPAPWKQGEAAAAAPRWAAKSAPRWAAKSPQ